MKINFSIENKPFVIEIETEELGPTTYVKLPIYDIEKIEFNKKMKEYYKNTHGINDDDLESIGMTNHQGFEYFQEDLQTLIPEKLDELDRSLTEISENCISKVVEKHINQYGQIMRTDLDKYVVETMMVCSVINKLYSFNEEGNHILYDRLFGYIFHKYKDHYIHTDLIDLEKLEKDDPLVQIYNSMK